jgi:putative DNA primase/helicase
VHATGEVIDSFRAALAARDIIPPVEVIADGRIHRCDAVGKHGKGDAAYLLHLDPVPVGGFENWRDGKGWETWRSDMGRKPSAMEVLALSEKVATMMDRRGQLWGQLEKSNRRKSSIHAALQAECE